MVFYFHVASHGSAPKYLLVLILQARQTVGRSIKFQILY